MPASRRTRALAHAQKAETHAVASMVSGRNPVSRLSSDVQTNPCRVARRRTVAAVAPLWLHDVLQRLLRMRKRHSATSVGTRSITAPVTKCDLYGLLTRTTRRGTALSIAGTSPRSLQESAGGGRASRRWTSPDDVANACPERCADRPASAATDRTRSTPTRPVDSPCGRSAQLLARGCREGRAPMRSALRFLTDDQTTGERSGPRLIACTVRRFACASACSARRRLDRCGDQRGRRARSESTPKMPGRRSWQVADPKRRGWRRGA